MLNYIYYLLYSATSYYKKSPETYHDRVRFAYGVALPFYILSIFIVLGLFRVFKRYNSEIFLFIFLMPQIFIYYYFKKFNNGEIAVVRYTGIREGKQKQDAICGMLFFGLSIISNFIIILIMSNYFRSYAF